ALARIWPELDPDAGQRLAVGLNDPLYLRNGQWAGTACCQPQTADGGAQRSGAPAGMALRFVQASSMGATGRLLPVEALADQPPVAPKPRDAEATKPYVDHLNFPRTSGLTT